MSTYSAAYDSENVDPNVDHAILSPSKQIGSTQKSPSKNRRRKEARKHVAPVDALGQTAVEAPSQAAPVACTPQASAASPFVDRRAQQQEEERRRREFEQLEQARCLREAEEADALAMQAREELLRIESQRQAELVQLEAQRRRHQCQNDAQELQIAGMKAEALKLKRELSETRRLREELTPPISPRSIDAGHNAMIHNILYDSANAAAPEVPVLAEVFVTPVASSSPFPTGTIVVQPTVAEFRLPREKKQARGCNYFDTCQVM